MLRQSGCGGAVGAADQGANGDPASAAEISAHGSNPVAEQIDAVKADLTMLRSRYSELPSPLAVFERAEKGHKAAVERANAVHDGEVERARTVRDAMIERARAECDAVIDTELLAVFERAGEKHNAAVERASAVHDASIERARAECDAAIECAEAEREVARSEVASTERKLEALVNAPVSGGRDPFEWLPDELIVMIMLMLSFEVMWSGVCERVCQRWARLMKSAPVTRRKREGQWAAYEAEVIEPRELVGHTDAVRALAVGLDGKLYSGSDDQTMRCECGRVSTAHTLRPSRGTRTRSVLSPWVLMARCTRRRGAPPRCECGLVTMADTSRPSRGTRAQSVLSQWD
jgi:hypothetical protein